MVRDEGADTGVVSVSLARAARGRLGAAIANMDSQDTA
ncbi:hypothetical protein DFQ13_102386 [Actinokineospora spheciospongiae]|nr:hypothetical protein DFQ13_102386 [Actinokineospora spheciospongiae]